MNCKPELNEGETRVGAIINADGTGNHIILLPGDNDDAPWQEQMDWAKAAGGDLPTRVEQALLFANHADQFKRDWYWSNTPVAGNESYAWCQLFTSGFQSYDRKTTGLRARAVRRVAIQ